MINSDGYEYLHLTIRNISLEFERGRMENVQNYQAKRELLDQRANFLR